ncbi:GGDEF domain-containing protein [Marinitoga sp. 1154]|uniref:GGDEF domain-containing protein n=1 Tax=Marinitoga sp. 1154 TaxID=1643335 RepID=UPI0015868A85|nr:GGDEF domain-containing protein [Marinitoga sp. 1154]
MAYKFLLEEYKKILDEYYKLISIADIQDNYLFELKKKLERKNIYLKNLSEKDKLTGLYNRLKFDEIINYQIDLYKREGRKFSLIMMDLDNFKEINDTFGHNIGDKILMEFSNILRKNLRKIDFVFRWGGDEFLIILPNTNLKSAIKVAHKLKKIILLDKNLKNITASIGLTVYNGENIDETINIADTALYNSKNSGRNKIFFYQRGEFFESEKHS